MTIATNAAGQGTDIILHPVSKENGGLHVILTFFPQNDRIENQGFGRCARQGQAGSCRLILQTKKPVNLLFLEKAQMVQKTSLERMQRIAIEQLHHQFLTLFWEKLQRFYSIPPERFTIQVIDQWLKKMKAENRIDLSSLNSMETLSKVAETSRQAMLGHLAQQYWASFFYDKLCDLDDHVNIEAFYRSCSPLWESIFEMVPLDL